MQSLSVAGNLAVVHRRLSRGIYALKAIPGCLHSLCFLAQECTWHPVPWHTHRTTSKPLTLSRPETYAQSTASTTRVRRIMYTATCCRCYIKVDVDLMSELCDELIVGA